MPPSATAFIDYSDVAIISRPQHEELSEYPRCEHCKKTFGDLNCNQCDEITPTSPLFGSSSEEKYFTICQVRQHSTPDSAWLLVGDTIYDATFYISRHPGGIESILKKSGGQVDCTVDFEFHSKKARRMWKDAKVGKLRPCNLQERFGKDEACIIC